MRKIKYVWGILSSFLMVFSLSVGVFAANIFEQNNLEIVYQTSNKEYQAFFYADDSMDRSVVPPQIKDSLDEAVKYVNVLRIYAGNCQEIDPANDSEALRRDYIIQAGIDNSQPALFFLRGDHQICFSCNEAFEDAYGKEAFEAMETHAFEFSTQDGNTNSYETNMCFALTAFMHGEYDEEIEKAKNQEESIPFEFPEIPQTIDPLEEESEEVLYTNPDTGFQAVVQDKASLIQNMDSLKEYMVPITQYENILFASTNYNSLSQKEYARHVGNSIFGTNADYSVFLLDMYNRQLFIFSSESMYRKIPSSKANIITDNVYKYASNDEYDTCAQSAFEQLYMVLNGDPLSSPMKFICCLLISLVGGLTICWIVMSSSNAIKKASYQEIESGMGSSNFNVSNVTKRLISTRFVKASSSSSRGGGGGFSGGHGGGGGGGGHGF